MDKPVKKVENSPIQALSPSLWRAKPGTLGIFAKEPQGGEVKTRLCPPLNFAEAAMVHHLLLRQTLSSLAPLQPLLFYSGNADYFRENFPGIPLFPQSQGELGGRMEAALRLLHKRSGERAILVGSDAPDLPLTMVIEACTALDSAEVVTIPAKDGGYVLIGERGHYPSLFQGVPWSSSAVLSCTRAICAAQQLDYVEIGSWEDVDDATDLLRLIKRSPTLEVSSYAAGILKAYGITG